MLGFIALAAMPFRKYLQYTYTPVEIYRDSGSELADEWLAAYLFYRIGKKLRGKSHFAKSS